ncbi:alpha/beta hydrolase family protein [Amycolatopsis sp. NPDC059021]|uniref:alpha/beta hydrolase family protein n=1 Tax=Amycolatopsis sp. NPDC059021 TaxID=3346704 RepID=UPI0036702580
MRSLAVAGSLALAATLGAAVPATAAPAAAPVRLTLPALTGPYQAGTTSLHLVDPRRKDPWVASQQRELMATVTYPVRHAGTTPRAPQLEPGMAAVMADAAPKLLGIPPGSVDWAATRRQAHLGAPADPSLGKRPVVLFSPGYGGPRELDTVLTDDLASRGYVVVSLSHTHESAAVEFPGGRIERSMSAPGDPVEMKKAIDARVDDSRFLLDQLSRLANGDNPDAEQRPLPRHLGQALDLSRVGMFGHSYGGYTSGETMYHDRRVGAGINLDGAMAYGFGANGVPYLPGEVVKHGLDRPFLLFGSELADPATGKLTDHNHLNPFDRSWVDFWAGQRGWKRDLTIDGSRHHSYSDLQAVVPQLSGLMTPANRENFIGTVDPGRSLTVQRDFVSGFFDLHLRGFDRHLFDGPSPCYPEVKFV